MNISSLVKQYMSPEKSEWMKKDLNDSYKFILFSSNRFLPFSVIKNMALDDLS